MRDSASITAPITPTPEPLDDELELDELLDDEELELEELLEDEELELDELLDEDELELLDEGEPPLVAPPHAANAAEISPTTAARQNGSFF